MFQTNTSGSKRTDVFSHLGKVINCLISIIVKLVKSRIYLLKIRSFPTSVRKNRLNRPHLSFVLLKTTRYWLYGELIDHVSTGIDNRISDVGQSRSSHNLKTAKFNTDCIYRACHRVKTNLFDCAVNALKPGISILKPKSLLEFIECRHGGFDVALKIFIVKLHRNYSFIDFFAHNRVTSLQAASASLSNIGWMAGFI